MTAPEVCHIDDCAAAVKAHGLCSRHHDRWRRWGDPFYATFEKRRGVTPTMDGTLTTLQAARRLGVAENTVKTWRAKGRIDLVGVTADGGYLFDVHRVEALALERGGPDEPMPMFAAPACRGRDDIDWVPSVETTQLTGVPTDNVTRAINVCWSCPHRQECAEWATRTRQAGIWGGLRTDQRRRLAVAL